MESHYFFFVIAIIAAAFILIPAFLLPEDIAMPDVTAMEEDQATAVLQGNDLTVNVESIYSEDVEEGYVVRTSPQADRMVKEESTVTIYVSDGPATEEAGNYVGQDYSQVERILEAAGYADVIVYERHSDRPVGEIIAQVQPLEGNEVVPSETRAIFEVSIGPESVSLNNLQGMTEQEARDYLNNRNLNMNAVEEHSDTTPEGEVIRQSPGQGTELEEGSTVNVYVSAGPEERPPRSHTITYTVPYESETNDQNNGNNENSGNTSSSQNNGNNESAASEQALLQNNRQTADKEEQTVRIYIDDMNNEISEVFLEDTITQDKEFTFTLTIPPDDEASYRITRDENLIQNNTISYEEGE